MQSIQIDTTKNHIIKLKHKKLYLKTGLLTLSLTSMVNAANPIVRENTQAFSFPQQSIAIDLAITTLNGEKYLQFINYTDRDNTFQNIIAGPIEKLMDATIPWSEAVYANHEFELISPSFPLGKLVDLNNDGINTLISGLSEYSITNTQILLFDDTFNGTVDLATYNSEPLFIDVDGDSDLDLITSDWKYGYKDYYENVGSMNSHAFVHRGDSADKAEAQYLLTLQPGFLDHFNDQFHYPFPSEYEYPIIADFDADGDMDLLFSSTLSHNKLKYYEQSHKEGTRYYSEPFSALPASDNDASWVTDFDSDGDLDVLIYKTQGELEFHERTNNNPPQYANPITITNFPQNSGDYYFAAHSSASISKSREIFSDIDHDGYQEMLFFSNRA
jgi:hypothetical protein